MSGGLPQPGDVLAGKYKILRVIGLGGTGIVLEAMHTRLSRRVAIKCLLPAMLEDPASLARFEREARAVARLRNRHVVRILDVESTTSGLPYMVMEMLRGNDLCQELESRRTIPSTEIVDWAMQICSALAEARDAGITHRDLKPSNIFLSDEPEGRLVKVLDFGVAPTVHSVTASTSGAIPGSPLYMSPEQIRSGGDVGPQSDLWSLGIILYEALGGVRPFNATNYPMLAVSIISEEPTHLEVVRHDLPEELCNVVMRTLEKDPASRPTDARTLAIQLSPFGSGREAIPASRVSLTTGNVRISVDGVAPLELAAIAPMPQAASVARSAEARGLPQTSSDAVASSGRRRIALALGVVVVATVVGVLIQRSTAEPTPSADPPAPTPSAEMPGPSAAVTVRRDPDPVASAMVPSAAPSAARIPSPL